MMVINHEYLEEYLDAFRSSHLNTSLLIIATDLIKSYYGELADKPLDAEFTRGVEISQAYLPTKLIRVLPTTHNKFELINSIVNTVMELWVRNERSITSQRIAERLFTNDWGSYWELFDDDAQKRFLDVAQETLYDMNQTEFNRYLGSVPGVRTEWRLLRLPDTEGKNQTKAYKAFQRAAQQYKWRILNDIPYSGRHIDQLTLDDIEGFIREN